MTTRLLLSLHVLVALIAPAPLAADDLALQDQLQVPAGLTVTLAAESPLLFNPTALDVDARGRLWVTEAVNYRKWGGRNPGREHPEGDRVVVLSDDDGDGVYDRSTVFAQDAELVSPLGIAVFGSRVVVSCSPHLFVYTDDDGDDVADRRETLLTGFGGFDHDHGLHSVVAGPDGRWWIAVGNAGPHLVTDRAGFALRSGSIYTGGGPVTADNKPGLVSDDGRVWTGGLVLSMSPDGTGLSVFAHNFRNNYEVAVDAFGDVYVSDNDDDGNRGCRTVWCLEGGDHGYFSADGARTWGADRRPGQDTATAHWHADDPGVVPSHTINGAGGPTGVAVYEGALLDDWCGGAVLDADAGAGVVYVHRPRREGAGVSLEPGELIRSRAGVDDPGATWFRPSDVVVAPDGSVLVADWYDPGVGGHLARDVQAYGRVLRIAPTGARTTTPEVELDTVAGLAAALVSPAVNLRGAALEALATGPEARARQVVGELTNSPDPRHRARGAGAAARLARAGQATPLLSLLDLVRGDEDARVRLAALRALRATGATPSALFDLVPLGQDPALDRELALALVAPAASATRTRDDARLARWLSLARAYPVGDRVAVEALGLAAEGLESQAWLALAEGTAPDGEGWSPRVAELAWRLHPAEAVPGLRARAEDADRPLAERRAAVDALGFVPDLAAAQAMVSLALVGPEDTRALARHWVERREADLWRDHGLGLSSLDGELGAAVTVWSSGVVRGGRHAARIDVTDAEGLWLVAGDGGDGNACDWADWLGGRFVTDAGEVPLSSLTPLRAEAAWGSVHSGSNCVGGPLRVDGVEHAEGLGTHAASVIAFAVPPGATVFEVTAAPDDGGTSQGRVTSIVFELRLTRRLDREALSRLEAELRQGTDDERREQAALELLAQDGGAMVLIELARAGVLDDDVEALIGEEIFMHPDGAVRALAHGLFPRVGGLAELPPLAELLALEGDVDRGRALFTDPRAQCSSCHRVRGRGGDVGPELSRIAEKLPREALLDAVLNPSAGVALGYEAWMVTASDGRRLTGFVLADGDDLLLKTSTGERVLLRADEVVERRPLSLSIMPEGVALGLSPQELADLLAFLLDDRAPPDPEAGDEVVLFDGRSLDAWRPVLSDPAADPADTWSIVDGELVCEGSPVGYLATRESFTDFVLELEWRFLPGRPVGNSGVLLRVNGPDRVWPRSVEAQLQAGHAGDIWNIEAMDMEVDPDRTRGRRTVKRLPSNERPHGEWNRYRITLDGDRLELEVNGEVQNRADWVERRPGPIALQSEGAPIAFRHVVLRRLRR